MNSMISLTVIIFTRCWTHFWKALICFRVLFASEYSWIADTQISSCYKMGTLKRNDPEQIIFQVCLVLANLHQKLSVSQSGPVVACRCLLVVKTMQPQSRICHQGPLSNFLMNFSGNNTSDILIKMYNKLQYKNKQWWGCGMKKNIHWFIRNLYISIQHD